MQNGRQNPIIVTHPFRCEGWSTDTEKSAFALTGYAFSN